MAKPLVSVTVNADAVKRLANPAIVRELASEIAERGVEIVTPIARDEAPRRTGKSAATITGSVQTINGIPTGVIKPGRKGFALRILATGRKASTISPRNRRGSRGRGRPRKGVRTRRPALLIPGRGGGVFFRYAVNVPALAPDPWPERVANLAEPKLGHEIEALIQRAYDRVP